MAYETTETHEDGSKTLTLRDNKQTKRAVIQYNAAGQKHGTAEWFYESGVLSLKIPYVNDKAEGTAEWFYESGALKSKTPWVNDEREGTAECFRESGELESKTPYVNNKREGTAEWFYESGALESKTPYVNDKAEGTAERFYESGALKSKTPYVNNKESGLIRTWNEDGVEQDRVFVEDSGRRWTFEEYKYDLVRKLNEAETMFAVPEDIAPGSYAAKVAETLSKIRESVGEITGKPAAVAATPKPGKGAKGFDF